MQVLSQWQTDLSDWFEEIMWIAAVLLAIIYIPNFDWKKSLPGKGFTILILAIIGSRLRNVLLIWGVINENTVNGETQHGLWDQVFTWISIAGLAAAGIAIVLLLIHTMQTLMSDPDHFFFKLGKKKNDRTP